MRKTLIASISLFIGGYFVGKHKANKRVTKKESFYKEQIKDLQEENNWIWGLYRESDDKNEKLWMERDSLWELKEKYLDENFEIDNKNFELENENLDLKGEIGYLETEVCHCKKALSDVITYVAGRYNDSIDASAISEILKDNGVQYDVTCHSQDDEEG